MEEKYKHEYKMLLEKYEALSREYEKFNNGTQSLLSIKGEKSEEVKKALGERKLIYRDYMKKFEKINKKVKILRDEVKNK